MRNKFIVSFIMIFVFSVFVNAQEQTMPQMSPEAQKMMQEWMKYASPGEPHKKLITIAGTYNVTGRSKFEPSGSFMDTTATCEKKAVLGDRWIHEHCEGPGMGGMPPFEGMGLLGFNNYEKQYEMHWFDNMSTMGFVLKGTADPAGKVITLKGTYEDPLTKKMKTMRWVLTIQDANKQKLELYDTDANGKEFLGTELNYTRKS